MEFVKDREGTPHVGGELGLVDSATIGVELSEVNFNTMESRIAPGLYFAGEVLDVDGITGGFNFQAAWSTGFVAGQLKGH